MDLRMEYEILLLQLGSLASKLYHAEESLKKTEAELDAAIKRLQKENLLLEKLERDHFSVHLLKILGSFKRVFNKEEEEIVAAKLEFDKAYARKISDQRRLLELEEEVAEKKNRLRDVKENLLRRNHTIEHVLTEKELERIKIQHEYSQTSETETTCYQVLESIQDILMSLEASETISNWDAITEIDFLLKYVSRDQLDAAEAMILALERNVQKLERELRGLHFLYENQYQVISSARPAIEDFFEAVFSDWSKKEVVENNLLQLKALEENVLQILKLLASRKQELEQQFALLKQDGGAAEQ